MQVHSRVPPDATTKYEGGDDTFPTLTKRVNVHVSVRGGAPSAAALGGSCQVSERGERSESRRRKRIMREEEERSRYFIPFGFVAAVLRN